MSERPISVATAAHRLGFTPQHVRRLIASGALEAIDGASAAASRAAWRVPPAAIRRFLTERDGKKRNQRNRKNYTNL